MWPKFLQSKWSERLFTAAISIIGITITLSVTGWRDSKASIRNELDKKATVEYVDKQDEKIMKAVETHTEESNKREDAIYKLFESMDSKLNILIENKK